MKKIYFILLIFFNWQLSWADVQIQVDPQPAQLGEPLKLIIKSEDNNAIPDLSILQKDFKITATERSLSYSIINNQAKSQNSWVVWMLPKHEGKIYIPAIKIGNQSTKPAAIEVKNNGNIQIKNFADNTDKSHFFQINVNTKSPFVNQEIIYSVKLFTNERLLNAVYQPPQIEDGLLIPLGNAKESREEKDGQIFLVTEQKYAAYFQKSGPQIINPPSLEGVVFDLGTGVQISAKPIKFNVIPIPANADPKLWLPAKKLTFKDQWQDQTTFKQGEVISRILEIDTLSSPAQFFPKINFNNTKAYNVYMEKISETNTVTQDGLLGSVKIKVNYLLNQAGDITIEPIAINWFNTHANKMESTILPAKRLQISAQPLSQYKDTTSISHQVAEPSQKQFNSFAFLGWLIAAIFAVIWLITVILWLYFSKPIKLPKSKRLWKRLENACNNDDADEAARLLINWAQINNPQINILNLNAIKQLFGDKKIADEIDVLNACIYKKTNKFVNWRGEDLWQALIAYQNKKPKKLKTEILPPLYE